MAYNGYVIEFISTTDDWKYRITNDEKTIKEPAQGFPFPIDAEINAKLYIDRLVGTKNGWIIS